VATSSNLLTSERPTFWRAAFVSVWTSLLFLAVYNATNWISSWRDVTSTIYFTWERHIPFVPEMILPYMSIDLFFVTAPFLCSTRLELRLLARRIALAIVFAGLCFLAFPLTLAVERPTASGAMGSVFNWFRGVDLPYNLCPSLHIALRTILADTFARHTRGLTRWASHIWFSLIGFSTLLTYQHHVIDVAGGFVLAAVCFYLVREAPLRLPVERNDRIGRMYALGSVFLAVAAISTRPWGLLLLYPAVSTALIAAGYFGLGPGVFGKSAGRLPLASRIVLAPVLFGQYLSLLYYRRQCHDWDEITHRVWIGRCLKECEAREAIAAGVTAVVDLTGEFSAPEPFLSVAYLHLPVLDLTAPSQSQLDEAVEFIAEHAARGIVYVHCKIGYSRSAAVLGSYLIAADLAHSADEAMQKLREVRPSIVIRPEAQEAIHRFAGRA
jgi:membrane-associated phospholipid phosphatase